MKRFWIGMAIWMLITTFTIFTYHLFSYQSDKGNDELRDDFVQLKDGKFRYNKQPFFPVALNFVVSLRTNDIELWPAVYVGYFPDTLRSTDKTSCLKELRETFQLVKDLGFNTVRITHIGEPNIRNFKTGFISFTASNGNNHDYPVYLENDSIYDKYLLAVEELLSAINDAGLKAIFTVRMFHEVPATEDHLKRLCQRFAENPTIMAYDLFNEPLYFDSLKHNKVEVYKHTKIWDRIIKSYAPHQLSTIGLACQRELFAWDPNMVNVDFLSMHPYEYEPDQVRNELYWYQQHIKKPWIIGETGIPSNNDSIPYTNQVAFAEKIFPQLINCNGQGFSWWQYKDLDWGYYHQNFLGVVNRTGFTLNSKNELVHGTPKPVTKTIKSFKPFNVKGKCECPENQYNYSQNKDFRLIGKLVDQQGNSLSNGGILAWDAGWVNHYFSATKPDGSFTIYSNYKFYHWMVSASLYETILMDVNPDSAKTIDGIPTIDLGIIKLKKIETSNL